MEVGLSRMNGKVYPQKGLPVISNYDVFLHMPRFNRIRYNPGLMYRNNIACRAYVHVLQKFPVPRIAGLLSAMTTGIIRSDGHG
jgi:hypothetical protein